MAAKLRNYSSIADIQEFWLTDIAPQYFNFEDTNLYRIGTLGYENEVMATVTADVFNAINIAKREFYSSTAENLSTFYKLAGIFNVAIPLTTPAACRATLIIQESDILSNSIISDGLYNFVLDSTMEISADTIRFSLDYPIKITAKYMNGAYSYTTQYDTTKRNSLSSLASKYIQNKTIFMEGRRYLAMSVQLHQYVATSSTEVITKNVDIDTVNATFTYDGNLAGFDVFYTADPGTSVETYIPAFTVNETTPASAYCIYEYLADNRIRITFPKSSYFAPKLNSEVRCCIYTSDGAGGNFDVFDGDLTCVGRSDTYLYNSSVIIRGIVNGVSSGGKDKPSDDSFIREIRDKNCTNGTITTSSDLQIYFNNAIDDSSVRVEFAKSRDDVLQRQYSAFILLKDDSENVIPTNSCDIYIRKSHFDVYEGGRGVIKPGKIFEYRAGNESLIKSSISMSDDLDPYDLDATSKFLFTNPFLISISTDTDIVGFYGNSIAETKVLEFSFVEERSFYQFICTGMSIDRNPIAGETYYTFTVKISSSSELDPTTVVTLPEADDVIRAKYSGQVSDVYYKDGAVYCRITYDTSVLSDQTEEILISSYSTKNADGTFTYHTGYELNYNVLDYVVQGDVIATKKVTDLGKIKGNLDLTGTFLANRLYVPMYIEEYDAEKDMYTLRGYISTNDFITLSEQMILDYGVYNSDGTMNDNVLIPMNGITTVVSIFYKNDEINYTNDFSKFDFFKNYTLTNQYATANNDSVDLIKGIDFIRSTLTYVDTDRFEVGDGESEDPENFCMRLGMVPVVKSNWIKDSDNFDYLINKIYDIFDVLFEAYFELENQYGIEMKFFNTYGTSKRYMIGIYDNMVLLDKVNCTMSVGVEVNAMTATAVFIEKYRTYLKNAIESLNDLSSDGKSLYILDLLAESKQEFPEIIHLEYYGFNGYGYIAQNISPIESPSSTVEVQTYVPEFINIYSLKQSDNTSVPRIEIKILNDTIS